MLDNTQRLRDYYNGKAHSYTDDTLDLGYTVPFHMAEMIKDQGIKKVKTFLDCGAGTGLLGITIKESFSGTIVTAMDIADKMLERALRTGFADKIIQHNIDCEPWPVEKESFDIVGAASVLSHISDASAFIRNMAAATRTGGHIILSHESCSRSSPDTITDDMTTYSWSDSDVVSILEKNYINIVESRYVDSYENGIFPIPTNIILGFKMA